MRLVEDLLDVTRTYAGLGGVSSCDRVDSSSNNDPFENSPASQEHE